jgi:HEAT repeat protein
MKKAYILVFCIIFACGLSPDIKAKNILENYLEDPSTVVRINAARSLSMIGDQRGNEVLIQILQEDDSDAQSAALRALYDIGEMEFNPLIIGLCGSDSPSVREAAYRVATRMVDTRAKDALITGLRDESAGVREIAYPGLARFGEQDLLQQGLHDPEPAVRIATASVMGDSRSDDIAELVRNELKKYTPEVWGRGIIALAQLGDTSSIPLFKALLEEGVGDLSVDAAEALLILDDRSGLEVLMSALQSRDPFVRIRAAQVLKRHDVVELRAQLVTATRDEYVSVAVLAVEALSQHDPGSNKKLFAELMDASHPVMQIAAAAAYLRS